MLWWVCQVRANLHYNECINNDLNRDRTVSEEVICRMYKHLNIPCYYEEWDYIEIYHRKSVDCTNTSLMQDISNMDYRKYCDNILYQVSKECIDMPQDNPHHTLSVSRHMYYTFDKLREDRNPNIHMQIAALLHDIGKPFCKFFKDGGRYANYYNHDNVSAQLAVNYLCSCNLHTPDILKIAQYIQLHMVLSK